MAWHALHLVSMLAIRSLCYYSRSFLLLLTPLNVLLDAGKQPCRDGTLLLADALSHLQAFLQGVLGIVLAQPPALAACGLTLQYCKGWAHHQTHEILLCMLWTWHAACKAHADNSGSSQKHAVQ